VVKNKIERNNKMKKRSGFLFFVLICLLFLFSGVATADDTKGIYIGILGGYVIPADMKNTFTDSDLSPKYDTAQDKGYLVGAKVGYLTPFTKRIMAIEMEYNRIEQKFDTSKSYTFPGGTPFIMDSKVQIDALMFNLLGRYPEGAFHPYIGAGAGYANVRINDIAIYSPQGRWIESFSSGSKGVFAYQFLVGIDFDVIKNINIGLGYKLITVQKVSYDSTWNNEQGRTGNLSNEAEWTGQNIVLSLSYLF
jgi:opacity protein-like surface antigen